MGDGVPMIKTWLPKFVADHEIAFPGAGWPATGSPSARKLWSAWLNGFIDAKVTEVEARAATAELNGEGLWCEEHPATVVEVVMILRRENAGKAERGTPGAISAAEASKGCVRCGGSGQATVYDPKFDGRDVVDRRCKLPSGEIRVIPYAMRVASHCDCPMGRWLRAKCDPELLPRIPDMAEILAGKSRWLACDPTEKGDIEAPDGAIDWRGLVAKMRDAEGAGGVIRVKDGKPV